MYTVIPIFAVTVKLGHYCPFQYLHYLSVLTYLTLLICVQISEHCIMWNMPFIVEPGEHNANIVLMLKLHIPK